MEQDDEKIPGRDMREQRKDEIWVFLKDITHMSMEITKK